MEEQDRNTGLRLSDGGDNFVGATDGEACEGLTKNPHEDGEQCLPNRPHSPPVKPNWNAPLAPALAAVSTVTTSGTYLREEPSLPDRKEDVNGSTLNMLCSQRENTYFVTGRFDRATHVLLLDTGCSHSVMPYSLYVALSDQCKIRYTPQHNRGYLADGSGITIQGVAETRMRIGGRTYLHHFQIAEISGKILLGMDFFRRYRCILDIHKYKLQIGDQTIPCCDADGAPLVINVQVQRSTVIPPQSQKIIEGRMSRETERVVDGIIEPRHKLPGLMVASSLHRPNGPELNVRILNASEEEIEIPSGTIIGQFVPIDEVETLLPEPDDPDYFRQVTMESKATELPKHLQSFVEQWTRHLTPAEKNKFMTLLQKYGQIFSKDDYDIGRTDVITHHIPLIPGAQPIKQNPYRQGAMKEAEIERQVQLLKEHDLIEEGTGPYSAPVVLVKKKDGKWRFCVDYRRLNAITHKDAYPLPRVDDSLDSLGGSQWFTTLDLTAGYWQITMDQDAKEKSAFVTKSGLWMWKVLPFGLTSAPSTFERLMETVMRGLQWETLLIYLDDIIVFSKDVETHIQRLDVVFQRLQGAGLKLKPAKCNFFGKEVEYLGHIVSGAGIATDPKKIAAVKEWPRPCSIPEVRAFIGTCSYYRRFIPGYTEVARPLSSMTGKYGKFRWDSECQESFERLKEALTSSPILAYPDFKLPYLLDTDASNVGSGGVLSQKKNEREHVIAYFSKTFTKEEKNYCVTRREMLAIVKAVKFFRPYLYGRDVTVRTDHASLTWLFRHPQPQGQLARWMEILTQFNITLEHRRGSLHGNADGLSRQCPEDCKQCLKMKQIADPEITDAEVLPCVLSRPEATLPSRGTELAAGLDLCSSEDKTILPGGRDLVNTGVQLQIPRGCYGRIAPRSGLSIMHSIDIGAGVIDQDYRGDVQVVIINNGTQKYTIKRGDKIAQLICERISTPQAVKTDKLSATSRGDKGFGSTSDKENDEVRISVVGVLSDIAKMQQADRHIMKIYKAKQQGKSKDELDFSEESQEARKLLRMIEHLDIRPDGTLTATFPVSGRRRCVTICPGELRSQVIAEKHRVAHLGIGKTTARVKLDWYWPGLNTDVRRHVTSCERCQQSKKNRSKSGSTQYHLYAGRPWQVLAVDLCGPFPKTPRGNTQILVMTDHFTRWCDAIPIPDGKADTVASVLDERVFSYFGVPEEIHSDQGRQFESQLFQELCTLWGSDKTRTSPYRPQANSVVERLNRTLGASLRALLIGCEQQDWDLLLPHIMQGIRATPHRITGETPNYLNLGREVRLPDSMILQEPLAEKTVTNDYAMSIQKRMEEAGQRLREQQYEVRMEYTEEPYLYTTGDHVWLISHQKKKGENPKLSPKYVGPYEITEVLPYHTYRVKRGGKETIQHEGRMRLHVEGSTENSVMQQAQVEANLQEGTEPTITDILTVNAKWDGSRAPTGTQKSTTREKCTHSTDPVQTTSSTIHVTKKEKSTAKEGIGKWRQQPSALQLDDTNTTLQQTNTSEETNRASNCSSSAHQQKEPQEIITITQQQDDGDNTTPNLDSGGSNQLSTNFQIDVKKEPNQYMRNSLTHLHSNGNEETDVSDFSSSSHVSAGTCTQNKSGIQNDPGSSRRSRRLRSAPHKLKDFHVMIHRLYVEGIPRGNSRENPKENTPTLEMITREKTTNLTERSIVSKEKTTMTMPLAQNRRGHWMQYNSIGWHSATTTESSLASRRARQHRKARPKQWKFQNKKMAQSKPINIPVTSAHPGYECKYCGMNIKERRSLKRHERRHIIQYACDSCAYTCKSSSTKFVHEQKLMSHRMKAVSCLPAPVNPDVCRPVPCYQDKEVQVNLVSIPPIKPLSSVSRSTEETNTWSTSQQTDSSETEVTSSSGTSSPEPSSSSSSGCETEIQRIMSNNCFVSLNPVYVPPSEPESDDDIFIFSPPAEDTENVQPDVTIEAQEHTGEATADGIESLLSLPDSSPPLLSAEETDELFGFLNEFITEDMTQNIFESSEIMQDVPNLTPGELPFQNYVDYDIMNAEGNIDTWAEMAAFFDK